MIYIYFFGGERGCALTWKNMLSTDYLGTFHKTVEI